MRSLPLIITVTLVFVAGCVTSPPEDAYARFRGDDLVLNGTAGSLFWFSGIHCNDPDHPMFADLERAFTEFGPDYVLVEGGFERHSYPDSRAAMLRGESAFVSFLAGNNGIPVGSMEPPMPEQIARLTELYSAEDILAMYMLRQTLQLQRESTQVAIDYPRRMLSYARSLRSAGLSLPLEALESAALARLLERYTGIEDPYSDWRRLPAREIVYAEGGSLHSVYRSVVVLRDDYGVERIAAALDEYGRVFVIMGADHIAAQESRLRLLF